MKTEDNESSGCPKRTVTNENIKEIHEIISDGSKMKFIDIADPQKISKEDAEHTVHEYLSTRKLCAKWVARELTIVRFTVSQINGNNWQKKTIWST